MPNRNYAKGRNFEYRIMGALRKLDFYCMRSYASKGVVDIIAVPPSKSATLLSRKRARTLLIQAKRVKAGYVRPAERTRLEKLAAMTEGLVVIMYPDNSNKLRADIAAKKPDGWGWNDVPFEVLTDPDWLNQYV